MLNGFWTVWTGGTRPEMNEKVVTHLRKSKPCTEDVQKVLCSSASRGEMSAKP